MPFASISRVASNSVDVLVTLRILAGNVLLFVPLGFFLVLRLRSRRPFQTALVGALVLSVFIEVTQATFPLGRVADVDDVILNVTGCLVGAVAAVLLRPAVRRSLVVEEPSR